ncbi:MAG: leucine-rich repeat domain-containing protein [Bacteroidaceae bacterium]|nr:leucine-rich repeat domain-containing protein [Bacteroidaceae bacterium]
MNNLYLKSLMVALGALLSLQANAYDAQVNGIYYNLVTQVKTAEVTSGGSRYTGKVVIPSTFVKGGVTYNVTSIGSHAFDDSSGLTSVIIPNSVTCICEGAFRGCSGLTSLTIPNSVISIDKEAFSGCSRLSSLTIPNSVTFIGKGQKTSREILGCSERALARVGVEQHLVARGTVIVGQQPCINHPFAEELAHLRLQYAAAQ